MKQTKADVARIYRGKFPDLPTLKLARIMYKENNMLFTNVEDARDRLRYIEGKKGKSTLADIPKSKLSYVKIEAREYNPYKLPESDETAYKPYLLNSKRTAIFNDIHFPYHSIEALSAAIKHTKKDKPDLLILNGDTADFYQLSRFSKDPKKRDFAGEINIMTKGIEAIQRELKCKIIFKLGNHEERYDHFLLQKAHEISGLDEFKLENIIKKRVPDIEFIGDKRIIKIGSLNVIHGHEFVQGMFNPVNVARGLYLRGKASAIQGHNHSTSEHTETDMNGKITTTWSIGCLCELHPAYMPLNKWNHGFAIVDKEGKDFEVRNFRIYKGKVL